MVVVVVVVCRKVVGCDGEDEKHSKAKSAGKGIRLVHMLVVAVVTCDGSSELDSISSTDGKLMGL